jgi:hypothetical protein
MSRWVVLTVSAVIALSGVVSTEAHEESRSERRQNARRPQPCAAG